MLVYHFSKLILDLVTVRQKVHNQSHLGTHDTEIWLFIIKIQKIRKLLELLNGHE